MPRKKRIAWSDEEDIRLLELRLDGKTSKQISNALYREFRTRRSRSSVDTRQHVLKGMYGGKDAAQLYKSMVVEDEAVPEIKATESRLETELEAFDHNTLRPAYALRENLVQKYFHEQSRKLELYRILNDYHVGSMHELMGLPIDPRTRVGKALLADDLPSEPLEKAVVILVPHGNTVSLLLPVKFQKADYLVDASIKAVRDCGYKVGWEDWGGFTRVTGSQTNDSEGVNAIEGRLKRNLQSAETPQPPLDLIYDEPAYTFC